MTPFAFSGFESLNKHKLGKNVGGICFAMAGIGNKDKQEIRGEWTRRVYWQS